MSGEIDEQLTRTEPIGSVVSWTPLCEITKPGAYVCRDSGDLLRVLPDGPASGDNEPTRRNETEPVFVIRLSSDPFMLITRARMEAANLDIEIRF